MVLAASTATSTTTSVVFWVLAVVSVVAALGRILSPRAVHCAVLLAVAMLSLAVQYAPAGGTIPVLQFNNCCTPPSAVLFPVLIVIEGANTWLAATRTHPGPRR